MLKKIICTVLSALMIVLATASVNAVDIDNAVAGADSNSSVGADGNNSVGADSSSMTTGAGNIIYFDASGWKNFANIYCHIWVRGGEKFFNWQSKKEVCKKNGSKYSYDLSRLADSTLVSGGMKSGTDYCVIFSADTGVQTYDLTFGLDCVGDTAKMTGKKIENVMDSNKDAYEAVWGKNNSKYGPHLAITSIGNIVGSKLCPNENGIQVIGDWLPTYYNSKFVNAENTLVDALKKFEVKDIQEVYTYILSKNLGLSESEYNTMQKMLENAYSKAYSTKGKINKNEAKKRAKKGYTPSANNPQNNGVKAQNTNSSVNNSGSGADGEEDTILIISALIMALSIITLLAFHKKKE